MLEIGYHDDMLKPLSLLIGLRYTRAKRRTHFISFISLASMLGIALGVAVLITVLSVMNGFDYQIQNRFFAMAPAVTILTKDNISADFKALMNEVDAIPDTKSSAPYVSGNGMLIKGTHMAGVTLMGIDPNLESRVSQLSNHLIQGKLTDLSPGLFNVILGQQLADQLNLAVGEKINIFTPQTNITLAGVFPRYKTFRLAGIYHTTGGLYDSSVAFINMQDAETLFLPGSRTSGLHIQLHDLYDAENVTRALQNSLSSDYAMTNWMRQYGAFFQALAMEKTMLFVILLLIVAVAAFNLVATLVMLVNDKRADIAILRTLGARPRTIMMTFIIQGVLIGVMGTALGLIGGIILALNVTNITNEIQNLFHVQFIQSSVYFINYLPSKIEPKDILEVCFAAIGLSILATIYPATLAFKTQPAEALRYE